MSRYPVYPEIASQTWEHPADKAALTALRAIPGLDDLVKITVGQLMESYHMAENKDKLITVNTKQHAKLYAVYKSVLHTFDVDKEWPLYLSSDGGINAMAGGMHSPFIIITIDAAKLGEDSVRMILAHEIGHLLAGHVLYRTMLNVLLSAGWWSGLVPITIPVYLGTMLAMLEWQRCSEFTADRASLLAMGEVQPVTKVLSLFEDPNKSVEALIDLMEKKIPAFMKPVLADSLNGLRRLTQTHPDPQIRIDALNTWYQSQEYQDITLGNYIRRGDDSLLTESTSSVQEELRRMGNQAQNLSNQAQEAAEELWNKWNPWSGFISGQGD